MQTHQSPHFFHLTDDQPHTKRRRRILKAHPEIKQLFGRNPWTALILLLVVGLQLSLGAWLGTLGTGYWWLAISAAYLVGAFANHCLYVIIHEATHNLIFRQKNLNKLAAVLADLPNAVPGSMGFRTYHLKHHAHMGEHDLDADLASDWEARLVGNSSWRKAGWLLFFPAFQIMRTFRLKSIETWTGWVFFNALVVLSVDALTVFFFGWNALLYLGASMCFAVGLHPLGARWIQEHYTLDSEQETFSYYGPLNILALNVGYHNEHHDFPAVPWNRLPQVKAMAPEIYSDMKCHTSWSKLLWEFIRNPEYTLYSRVTRPSRECDARAKLDKS